MSLVRRKIYPITRSGALHLRPDIIIDTENENSPFKMGFRPIDLREIFGKPVIITVMYAHNDGETHIITVNAEITDTPDGVNIDFEFSVNNLKIKVAIYPNFEVDDTSKVQYTDSWLANVNVK